MAKGSPAKAALQIKLRVDEALYDHFAERAAKHGRDAEEEMVLRLRSCREHTASAPIYLNDDQRNELSQISGIGMSKPEDVVDWARRVSAITVGGVTVELSERLLTRLSTRTFGRTFEEHIRRVVTEQLEQLVGMR